MNFKRDKLSNRFSFGIIILKSINKLTELDICCFNSSEANITKELDK